MLCLAVALAGKLHTRSQLPPDRLHRLWRWHLRSLLLPPGGKYFNLRCLTVLWC